MQAQNERTSFWFSQALSKIAHGLGIKVSIFFPLENVAEAKPLFSCSYRHKSTIHAPTTTTTTTRKFPMKIEEIFHERKSNNKRVQADETEFLHGQRNATGRGEEHTFQFHRRDGATEKNEETISQETCRTQD
jgi:hypothetical protein